MVLDKSWEEHDVAHLLDPSPDGDVDMRPESDGDVDMPPESAVGSVRLGLDETRAGVDMSTGSFY